MKKINKQTTTTKNEHQEIRPCKIWNNSEWEVDIPGQMANNCRVQRTWQSQKEALQGVSCLKKEPQVFKQVTIDDLG